MNILYQVNQDLQQTLSTLPDRVFDEVTPFRFNTGDLLEYAGKGTETSCAIWKQFWDLYKDRKSPVIYWFQFPSDAVDAQDIVEAFSRYKESRQRSVPAYNSYGVGAASQTMYVGCCAKTMFRDRVFSHLGYYSEGRTQGLQLCHWARPLAIPLTLHSIFLPTSLEPLTTLYEKELARAFAPLFGKHA